MRQPNAKTGLAKLRYYFGKVMPMLPAACLISLAVRLLEIPAAHAGEDGNAARTVYSQKIAAKYYAHFDDAAPFLPSNATTDTGEFVDPRNVPTAAYCAHCHQESHRQWSQSAHANSFRAPWYQKNVKLLIATKGVEYSRHCEGCHNPIALTSGSITRDVEQKRPLDEEGVTCVACHSIRAGDTRGAVRAMADEAKVRTDPELGAGRFVERWQALSAERGDASTGPAADRMAEMVHGLRNDPALAQELARRAPELGLGLGSDRQQSVEKLLERQVTIDHDRQQDRDLGL